MQMNKLIKKQVTLSIFSFVLISLIVIGSSNALLRGTTQTESVKSKIGELMVDFTGGNTINLEVDPTEDTDSINDTTNIYTFKVTNSGTEETGSVPYSYRIYLVNDSSTVDPRFIKYCLVDASTTFTETTCIPSAASTSTTFDKTILKEQAGLLAGQSKEYKLKVWLAMKNGEEYIPNESIGGKISLKINVCAQSGLSLDNLTSC